MMQSGLHIGVAAWIKQLRSSDDFLSCTATPKAITLSDLQSIQNNEDLVNAMDFSNMVNFIPRLGSLADHSSMLWRDHRNLLQEMDFASSPWTAEEQVEYDQAISVLFDSSDPSSSPIHSAKRIFYSEYAQSYEDLRLSGGSSQELTLALTDWITFGSKVEVEQALETIQRLLKRSSLYLANTESESLEENLGLNMLNVGGTSFAPVYFTPISAVSKDTWMEATVSFKDLDSAAVQSPYLNRWRTYLANRKGTVTFTYAAIDCIRPWFTESIYGSDDWRLTTENGTASSGNGQAGRLPAYVNSVYLVSIKNVTIKPGSTKPSTKRTRNTGKLTNVVVGLPRIQLLSLTTTPTKAPEKALIGTVNLNNLGALNQTKLSNLNVTKLASRYEIATLLLNNNTTTIPTSNSELPTYIVGFGCKKIPYAPNPNPDFKW